MNEFYVDYVLGFSDDTISGANTEGGFTNYVKLILCIIVYRKISVFKWLERTVLKSFKLRGVFF